MHDQNQNQNARDIKAKITKRTETAISNSKKFKMYRVSFSTLLRFPWEQNWNGCFFKISTLIQITIILNHQHLINNVKSDTDDRAN